MPVFGGYIQKICIYLGYWHSIDGWNYDKHEAKEWQEVKWESWMEYRWKGEDDDGLFPNIDRFTSQKKRGSN